MLNYLILLINLALSFENLYVTTKSVLSFRVDLVVFVLDSTDPEFHIHQESECNMGQAVQHIGGSGEGQAHPTLLRSTLLELHGERTPGGLGRYKPHSTAKCCL